MSESLSDPSKPIPNTTPGKLGDRRKWDERWQVCLGPCAYCGGPVWRFEGEPRTDGPLTHQRTCERRLAGSQHG